VHMTRFWNNLYHILS